MAIYLDNNATTPLEAEVREIMLRYFDEEYGNAGSRTHEYGSRAKQAVQQARNAVAAVVQADASEVVFTSGATEANNLALLGLAEDGRRRGRNHIVTTAIEHKAVLEPLEALSAHGFEVTIVPVGETGRVATEAVLEAVRSDTLAVSVMQANNETGVMQPIAEIAEGLEASDVYLHVDAAQGYGKSIEDLRHRRIDLISVSGHKLFAPKGVGALIARRRGYDRPPLTPLAWGGGQERGLRPGTLPVPLLAAFGAAAELASRDAKMRRLKCEAVRLEALNAFAGLDFTVIGDTNHVLPHVLNLAFHGVDSEALMLSLKDLVAVSNGSACTSSSYEPSHVLKGMGLSEDLIGAAVRLSWSHLTPDAPWEAVADRISDLQKGG
ncbi:cysteine desulfurase DndA [Brevundimonas bullata]